jgi:hypothetical protein
MAWTVISKVHTFGRRREAHIYCAPADIHQTMQTICPSRDSFYSSATIYKNECSEKYAALLSTVDELTSSSSAYINFHSTEDYGPKRVPQLVGRIYILII